MNRLPHIIEKLCASQEALLRAADAVAPANWQRPPATGRWSAAELVAHLCQVERGILGYADRLIRKPPAPVSFLKRWHLPMALVESRVVRGKTPSAPDAASLAGKETMIAETRCVRERTLAFLEETQGRNLLAYRWRHPFLGRLNFYEWFTFVAAHQARHTKQMREIAKNLPKDGASSRK